MAFLGWMSCAVDSACCLIADSPLQARPGIHWLILKPCQKGFLVVGLHDCIFFGGGEGSPPVGVGVPIKLN